MNEEWMKIDRTVRFLRARLGSPPKVLIVLGSGLGGVAAGLENMRSIRFSEIPGWPTPTVEGHDGELMRGKLAGVEVLIQLGRVHLYEGYTPAKVVRPVRVAVTWGAKMVIFTNAAGGVNTSFKPGDLMMFEDHINLTGLNPLRGPNDDSRGTRFPDMTDVYDSNLRAVARHWAAELSIMLRTGVYAGVRGPSYETPAEVRMLNILGADAVGMSTVLEAIAVRHLGARLMGISSITNQAAASNNGKLTHDEVQMFAARASHDLVRLISAILGDVGDQY